MSHPAAEGTPPQIPESLDSRQWCSTLKSETNTNQMHAYVSMPEYTCTQHTRCLSKGACKKKKSFMNFSSWVAWLAEGGNCACRSEMFCRSISETNYTAPSTTESSNNRRPIEDRVAPHTSSMSTSDTTTRCCKTELKMQLVKCYDYTRSKNKDTPPTMTHLHAVNTRQVSKSCRYHLGLRLIELFLLAILLTDRHTKT